MNVSVSNKIILWGCGGGDDGGGSRWFTGKFTPLSIHSKAKVLIKNIFQKPESRQRRRTE